MDTCQVKFDSAALGLTSPCPSSNMYFLINYDCVQSEQNQMPVLRLVVLLTFEITFRESILFSPSVCYPAFLQLVFQLLISVQTGFQ